MFWWLVDLSPRHQKPDTSLLHLHIPHVPTDFEISGCCLHIAVTYTHSHTIYFAQQSDGMAWGIPRSNKSVQSKFSARKSLLKTCLNEVTRRRATDNLRHWHILPLGEQEKKTNFSFSAWKWRTFLGLNIKQQINSESAPARRVLKNFISGLFNNTFLPHCSDEWEFALIC